MAEPHQSSTTTSLPVRRRWFRFSLRALLLFITLVGPGMGWVRARRQSQYEVQIVRQMPFESSRLDGPFDVVFPDGTAPQGWWRDVSEYLLGQRITAITGLGRFPMKLELATLSSLSNLQMLNLNQEHISNLAPLAGATKLRCLWLCRAEVSDLTPLAGLALLIELDLGYTEVSDLAPLTGLRNLQVLHLNDTPVRDLKPLAGLDQLRCLTLNNTHVVSLRPLAALTQLQELYVNSVPALEQEVEWLERQLPQCQIHR